MKRGRNQRRRQGNNPNRAFDSNGPDVRIRGTANQIHDKYIGLARDSASAGDRVKAENYLQHAEHYFRVIRSMQPAQQESQNHIAEVDGSGEQPAVGNAKSERRSRSRRDGDQETGSSTTPDETESNDEQPVVDEMSSTFLAESDQEISAKPPEDEESASESRPRQRRKRRPRTSKVEKSSVASEEATIS